MTLMPALNPETIKGPYAFEEPLTRTITSVYPNQHLYQPGVQLYDLPSQPGYAVETPDSDPLTPHQSGFVGEDMWSSALSEMINSIVGFVVSSGSSAKHSEH